MQLNLKFYGLWRSLVGVKEKEIFISNGSDLNAVINMLYGLYGDEVNDLFLTGQIFHEDKDFKFKILDKEDVVTDKSTIIFIGPIEGG